MDGGSEREDRRGREADDFLRLAVWDSEPLELLAHQRDARGRAHTRSFLRRRVRGRARKKHDVGERHVSVEGVELGAQGMRPVVHGRAECRRRGEGRQVDLEQLASERECFAKSAHGQPVLDHTQRRSRDGLRRN